MAETNNYQMAIDLLRCHLGISEDEAKQQLGISTDDNIANRFAETQQALTGLNNEN